MTPKDTGFLQQHVEKIVLGVALLLVLIVLWLYYLGHPYSIKLGAGEQVPPAEVMDEVARKVSVLDSKLRDPDSPLPDTPVPDYTSEFVNRFRRAVIAMDQYPVPPSQPGLGDFEPAPPPTRFVVMPPVPAPTQIKARAGYNVLAESPDPRQNAALIELIGQQVPRDFEYASVSAVFSREQLQQALRQVDIDNRIPEAWWRNRLLLTRVELNRQELDPLTGQWGEPIAVAMLPNQIAYGLSEQEYQQVEAAQIIEQAAIEQASIARPPFPPALNVWTPPDIDVSQKTPEENRKLLQLDIDIARLRRQLQTLESRGEKGAAATRAMPDGARRTAGGEPTTQIQHLRGQLDAKVAERNQLLGLETADAPDMRDSFTPDDEMMPPTRRGRRPGIMPGSESEAPDAQADQIKVWAHDLTVEPGRTYRYQIRVHVLNPLFQKRGIDPEQEKEQYHKLSVASEPSAWSEPVTAPPMLQFFLVDAAPTNARLEIWRRHNGQWERHDMTVRPGELMGQDVQITAGDIATTVSMKINAMLVDLREVSSGSALRDSTYEMLYVDLDNGDLKIRNLTQDLNDPELLRLRAERARGSVALQP